MTIIHTHILFMDMCGHYVCYCVYVFSHMCHTSYLAKQLTVLDISYIPVYMDLYCIVCIVCIVSSTVQLHCTSLFVWRKLFEAVKPLILCTVQCRVRL